MARSASPCLHLRSARALAGTVPLVLALACGGYRTGEGTAYAPPSTAPAAPAQPSQVVYAAGGSGKVRAYGLDPATGDLAPVPSGLEALPAGAFGDFDRVEAFALAPDGTMAYLSLRAGGADSVTGLLPCRRDPATGRLSPLDADAARPGLQALAATGGRLVVDPAGRFLLQQSNSCVGGAGSFFTLDAQGNPTRTRPASPDPSLPGMADFGTPLDARDFVAHPSGRFVYAPAPGTFTGGPTLSTYAVDAAGVHPVDADPGTPALDAVPAPGDVLQLVPGPDGHYLYGLVGLQAPDARALAVFRVDPDTGLPTLLPANGCSPTQGLPGLLEQRAVMHPSGRFLFVVGYQAGVGGEVSVMAVDPSTGALRPLGHTPFAALSTDGVAAVDPSGRVLLVHGLAGPATAPRGVLFRFRLDPATGAVTPLGPVDDAWEIGGLAIR